MQVLREAGEPMHYLDITEQIVQRRLRAQPGATPSYSVAAQFSIDKQLGERSKFVWVSKGIYGLREWIDSTPVPVVKPHEPPEASPLQPISVQAYGIYWERSFVDWKKSSPKLLGQQFENADTIDFGEQRGIYVLFDHRDLVYVGRATALSMGSRLRDHTVDRLRSRWDRFSWFGFYLIKEDGSLQAPQNPALDLDGVIAVIEAVLIELTEPAQNRQQGKGFGGIEYLQKPDPSLRNRQKQDLLGVFARAIDAQADDS